MTIQKIAILLFVVLAATGCNQHKPPECFSPETIKLVKEIVSDLAVSNEYPLASKLDMESMIDVGVPTPTAYDKDVKRFTCEGSLSISNKLPPSQNITIHTDPETLQKIRDFGDSLCPDQRCQKLIKFTSQTVNDGHVVSVEGVPKWILSSLALQAQIIRANKLAKSKAEEIAKKETLVSTCDDPAILREMKIMYAEKLINEAEKRLKDNGITYTPITPENIIAIQAQIDKIFIANEITKVDFIPDPVKLSCSAEISLEGLLGVTIPAFYALEPAEDSSGGNQHLYIGIEFSGTHDEYRALIAIREHLLSKVHVDQKQQHSDSPSFDCNKARTNVEHMICNSPHLAKADAAMGSLYRSALQSAQDVKAFKDEGSTWLQQRNQCQDEACLVDIYQMRVNQLSRKDQ